MSETIFHLRSEIRRLEDDKERQQIQYNDQCVAREITVIFSPVQAVHIKLCRSCNEKLQCALEMASLKAELTTLKLRLGETNDNGKHRSNEKFLKI